MPATRRSPVVGQLDGTASLDVDDPDVVVAGAVRRVSDEAAVGRQRRLGLDARVARDLPRRAERGCARDAARVEQPARGPGQQQRRAGRRRNPPAPVPSTVPASRASGVRERVGAGSQRLQCEREVARRLETVGRLLLQAAPDERDHGRRRTGSQRPPDRGGSSSRIAAIVSAACRAWKAGGPASIS